MITKAIAELKAVHSDKMLSISQDIFKIASHGNNVDDEREYLAGRLSYHRGAYNALIELEQKIVSDRMLSVS